VIQADDGIDHILHDDLAMVKWDNFTARQQLLQEIGVTVALLLEEAREDKESTDG
jgi:hypothetical protein